MKLSEKIYQLRDRGLSYRQIEKKLGCSRSIISYHCSKRSDYVRFTPVKKDLSHLTSNTLLNFLIQEGICRTNIADALSIPYSDLLKYIKENNFKKEKVSGYARVKLRRRHLKLLALAYRGWSCKLCGYNKCLRSLQFHHLDPSKKDFTLSTNANRSWSKIKKEVSKCDILCANCHGEVHDGLHPTYWSPS